MKKSLFSLTLVIMLLLLIPNPVLANGLSFSVVETDAVGTIEVEPDICYINLNVITEATSSTLSQQQNAEVVNKVIQNMINNGIQKKDITTGRFSTYNYQVKESSTIKYITNASMGITVKDLDKVGVLLTELAKIKDVNISNIRYDVANVSKYKQAAINQAIKEARENIEMTAKSLRMTLDKVQRVRISFHNSSSIIPIYAVRGEAVMDSLATPQPQNPENIKISASVHLEYSIK